MDPLNVKGYFEKAQVVCDYARAVEEVGLWNSEKIVFGQCFSPDMRILELGCGAGRIAHGLCGLGFKNVTATDFSESMIESARAIAAKYEDPTVFEVQDATALPYDDESFDGAIFGFNGLMQIPRRANRRKAVKKIFDILKKGSFFVFTTHDREAARNRDYWEAESKQWLTRSQHPLLDDFGDLWYAGAHGNIFIHSPVKEEVREDLEAAGFRVDFCRLRSKISEEPEAVLEFSDDCIFWAARKPD